jgi:ribokinase
MEDFDFVAIGDITTDAFIRLREPGVHCHMDRKNLELCMYFGEKIPYEFVEVVSAVGNSPNASVCAKRLGLNSSLVTNLGNDKNGNECLESLKKEKVNTSFIKQHQDKETNYHYVLWFEDDRTILVKHHSYEYNLPDIGKPKAVYLSSIGENTENYHDQISEYLNKNPEIKLIFQPGTFQIKLGVDRLKKIYQRTDIFAVNKREAQTILNSKENDVVKLLSEINKLGPKTVLITDGTKGAYLLDNSKKFFMPVYPDKKPPYERTGAGDSYTTTFSVAKILGKSNEESLQWAGINALSVIQQIGAQRGLLNRNTIEETMKNIPSDYRLQEI